MAVGAGQPDKAEFLGVGLGPVVVAVVPGMGVDDLHAVQIAGDGGGALLAVGMGLDQQGTVLPGQLGELHHAHFQVPGHIPQQLVVPAEQQVVVVALVKAQLRALVDPDAQLAAGVLHPVEAVQEFFQQAVGRAQVQVQVLHRVPVVVVGDGNGVVTGLLVGLRQNGGGQVAALAGVGGVEMGLDLVHGKHTSFRYLKSKAQTFSI